MLKKFLSLVLAASFTASLLVGCGSANNSSDTKASIKTEATAKVEPAKDVTLTLWQNSSIKVQENTDIENAFLKANPNIHFNIVEIPNTDTSAILSAIAAGNAPAIYNGGYPQMMSYIFQGAALPLDDFIAQTPDFSNFEKSQVESFNFNGKHYAVPTNMNLMGFVYNKKLFKEAGITAPPTTWDEFYEDCVKLTKPEKQQYGFAMSAAMWGCWPFETWVWGAGGDLSKKNDDGTVTLTFTDPAVKLASDFWIKLRNAKVIQPDLNATVDDLKMSFALEEAAIWWWNLFPDLSLASSGTIKNEDIGYFPYLKGPSGKGYSQIGGDVSFIVTTKDKDIAAAAWKWLMFQYSRENWDILFKKAAADGALGQRIFPRTDLKQSDYKIVEDPGNTAAIQEGNANMRKEFYAKGAVGSVCDEAIAKWFTDPNADVMKKMKEAEDKANAKEALDFNNAVLASKK